MATKIKLKRLGKKRQPQYRVVVADARTKRDGRVIEEIGKYHPKQDPSFIEVDAERAAYWLGVGAQPTEPVRAILRVTGDWQKFHGEPAPPPMRVAEPKADRMVAFEAAHAEGQAEAAAITPKKKSAPKADTPKADDAKADTAKADTAKADTAKADTAKVDTAKVDDAKADEAKADEGTVADAPVDGTTADAPKPAEKPAEEKASAEKTDEA